VPELALWRCSRKDELALREWPDGVVVFDDANGHLNCLNLASGALLELLLLSDTQWTSERLAQELLGEHPTTNDIDMVENALAEFSSLNFIDRVAV
jgi:hypothetical protein